MLVISITGIPTRALEYNHSSRALHSNSVVPKRFQSNFHRGSDAPEHLGRHSRPARGGGSEIREEPDILCVQGAPRVSGVSQIRRWLGAPFQRKSSIEFIA